MGITLKKFDLIGHIAKFKRQSQNSTVVLVQDTTTSQPDYSLTLKGHSQCNPVNMKA
jgi:hypothetical protein